MPSPASELENSGSGKKLTLNAIHLVWGQVASAVLALVTTAALGRGLNAADFGLYYTATSIATFAFVFVDWGQTILLMQEAARKSPNVARLVSSAILFRVIAASCALSLIATTLSLTHYDASLTFLTPLAVACALPLALSQPFGAVFRGWDRMDLDVGMTLLGKLIAMLLTIAVLYAGGGVVSFVVVQVAGGFAACAFAARVALQFGLRLYLPRPQAVRELFVSGAPLAYTAIALALQPFLDVMILSSLTSHEVVGWFCAGRNIFGLLVSPAIILSTAVAPELARLSKSPSALREVLENAARLVFVVATIGAAGIILYASTTLSLIYGEGRFESAVPILWASAAVMPILVLDILLGCVLTAMGWHYAVAVSKALSVVASGVLSFVLIPICEARFGNGGIGPMVAFAITELLMLVLFFRILPRDIVKASLLFGLGRSFCLAAATLAIMAALPPLPIWLSLPIFALVIVTLAVVTRMLLVDDVRKGLAIVRELMGRIVRWPSFWPTRGR